MFLGTGTSARPRSRSSVYKLLGLCGVIAGMSLASAAPASAATCSPSGTPACYPLDFHNVVMDTQALGGTAVVTPSGTPLQVDVTPTAPPDSSGNLPFAVTGWSFPTYHFNSPVPGTIDINPNPNAAPPTGTVNVSSGAVTMTGDLQATVNLGSELGSCTIDTGTVSLSTSAVQPLLAQNFAGGLSGIESGAGSLGLGWTSAPPASGSGCPVISTDLAGAGGIWMSGDITPPSVEVTHSKVKKIKARKTEKIKVTLANSGGAPTGAEKVCLKAPKGIKGGGCKTISNVAGGASSAVTFKVKATKKKTKKYTLKLKVTPTATALLPKGGAAAIVPTKLTLKVKK